MQKNTNNNICNTQKWTILKNTVYSFVLHCTPFGLYNSIIVDKAVYSWNDIMVPPHHYRTPHSAHKRRFGCCLTIIFFSFYVTQCLISAQTVSFYAQLHSEKFFLLYTHSAFRPKVRSRRSNID